ncbi:MAG TPA: hypothetical protein VGM07_11110 [Stellaceae bacterium]|jgi:hypothetical protein
MPARVAVSVTNTTELYHLSGGLRAATTASGHLVLFPTNENKRIGLAITDKRQYLSVLSGLGLEFVGYERVSRNGGLRHSWWELFDPNQPHGFHIIDIWKQITFSAKKDGNVEAETVARSINFALRSLGLRLRDLSNQYHFQNIYAAVNRIKAGTRFMNVQTFDTYMNLHSMLVEMCSARDHLGVLYRAF